MWAQFSDSHSGGSTKEPPYEKIYIEAHEKEAKVIFQNRFGHNPHRVTCTCCGPDYSICEDETLEEITAYERGCRFDSATNLYVECAGNDRLGKKYCGLEEYEQRKDVLIIRKEEIKDEERIGELRQQGYVWVG